MPDGPGGRLRSHLLCCPGHWHEPVGCCRRHLRFSGGWLRVLGGEFGQHERYPSLSALKLPDNQLPRHHRVAGDALPALPVCQGCPGDADEDCAPGGSGGSLSSGFCLLRLGRHISLDQALGEHVPGCHSPAGAGAAGHLHRCQHAGRLPLPGVGDGADQSAGGDDYCLRHVELGECGAGHCEPRREGSLRQFQPDDEHDDGGGNGRSVGWRGCRRGRRGRGCCRRCRCERCLKPRRFGRWGKCLRPRRWS